MKQMSGRLMHQGSLIHRSLGLRNAFTLLDHPIEYKPQLLAARQPGRYLLIATARNGNARAALNNRLNVCAFRCFDHVGVDQIN
jgi:hypothetical protein